MTELREVWHVGPRELMHLYLRAHKSPDLLAMEICVVPPTHWDFEGVSFEEAFNQVALARSMKVVLDASMVVQGPSTILDNQVPTPNTCENSACDSGSHADCNPR